MRYREGVVLFVVGTVSIIAACGGSDSSSVTGCAKDTDCVNGRICGAEGRCVDPTTGLPGPSGGDAAASSSSSTGGGGGRTAQQLACDGWLSDRGPDGGALCANCACETMCLSYSGVSFCGHVCDTNEDCRTWVERTFGPDFGTTRCEKPSDPGEDSFCIVDRK